MPHQTPPALAARLREIFAARDRADMQPTIEAFLGVLAEHPEEPEVLYEVGGAYDTAGEEETAAGYYERAMASGLSGDALRRCLLQYGSTLRNLGRLDESVEVLERARRGFPDSDSLKVWHATSLHEAGRHDAAVAILLELIADRVPSEELARYEPALRGNAAFLAGRDARS